MFGKALDIVVTLFKGLSYLLIPVFVIIALFFFLCFVWVGILKYKYKWPMPEIKKRSLKRMNMLKQLLVEVPKRYVMDIFKKDPDFFDPRGIHMFCGEQGAGKTIAAVEMIMHLQKSYPFAKTITNFGLTSENDELNDWHQLLDYTNGHMGVIVGIDEIQNWFMSGLNKLPEGMLEVATQNRKNNRILVCTAQVFTRVNKGLREQVTCVYQPHTVLGCFTVVIKRKPVFDSEGNVLDLKYRGMYAFTHNEELRNAYDTYKVIHTLSKEGFKDPIPDTVTNVYIAAKKQK